ncbi:NACHT domain-containing protein [Streptomyces xanthophaeus]|uniref:NACHT domain-containing protein n=1 Tax=Streptomyces xanthophaeus TaxID=67385 RepID=UPI0004CC971E|nr:NACHT domain-containing protein [Streptomyces xanthophaeus]
MTGFETVLLRVAGTAAGALLKSLLARAPGAGLAADPARPAPRWRRPAELGDAEVRRLAEVLAARLGEATARLRLPEHERAAAVEAVGDAFAALGTLDAETLFAADLDPDALAAALPAPPPGLSPAAEALYARLTRLCCAHAVEYATTLPGFGARADVELVRRTGALTRSLERLQDRPDGSAHAFEERYAEYVARTHGRLQLFGLTLSRSRQEWPLDVAYISLAVSGEQIVPGEAGMHLTSMKAEQALGASRRMLLRGPAGSGKSTLVQWLALNAARRTFGPELRAWNGCVPFVLRLRSFTAAASLPLPEEFLRASGVPLTAPAGWAEQLMSEGRAVVLVDGVDEVPQRLRMRTESWLRSLISAFPKARYVVTTRSSAVPEGWLAHQDFTPHSLLPMERGDVRAFVSHWHASAREECGSPAELARLDAYETSLLEAVGTRRDLGQLATNPLMCALLCALNQDRRMQLPRARKELYDAALDMLLVRRDTEREISGVEGVYLTRDEQILLLQRLAYWLIRNGQVEAARDEAVEMVAEWMDAMPQVRAQGSAGQVFMHLLIRSGLLREPVPGAVNFVHRTFQDYLGAKAAVEERDFGVLVQHAHDDTWEDVIRMSVGHARPAERARLLRGLLRRADRVKRDHSRLVLLAASCLEHAPELEPGVRADIEHRTAALLPPRSVEQADELAKVGELVLELLPEPADLTEDEAAATVRTAALVGGVRALELITGFRDDGRFLVCHELSTGWRRFKGSDYVDAVLSHASLGELAFLEVSSAEQLALLPRVPHLSRVRLEGDRGIPQEVLTHPDLEMLYLSQNNGLSDLSALSALPRLTLLGFDDCRVTDLDGIRGLALRTLYLYRIPDGLDLSPVAGMASLDHLGLDFAPGIGRVADLPVARSATALGFYRRAHRVSLAGLEEWTALNWLTVSGDDQAAELGRLAPAPPLGTLQLLDVSALDPGSLVRHQGLTDLFLSGSTLTGGLEPLRELPRLGRLGLNQCGPSVDITPLAGLPDLRIEVSGGTRAVGGELFPPGRIRFSRS